MCNAFEITILSSSSIKLRVVVVGRRVVVNNFLEVFVSFLLLKRK